MAEKASGKTPKKQDAEKNPADTLELTPEKKAAQKRLPLKKPAPSGDETPKPRPQRRRKDSVRLVWDSKPKRSPSPRDIEFQTAEVVIPNPARDEAKLPLSFHDGVLGNEEIDKAQMNRLIWGDNLLAMQAMLTQGYEGKIDLIYIDPPFDSKSDYSHRMTLGDSQVTKGPSVIERLAYTDTWEGGLDSYLDMIYPRLQLIWRLLSERGSLYVHLDRRVSSHVRIILDDIFGPDKFINEVIWSYQGTGAPAVGFKKKHDTLLFYGRSDSPYFDKIAASEPMSEKTRAKFTMKDEHGRRYKHYKHPDGTYHRQYYDPDKLTRKRDVWSISTIQSWNEKIGFDTQKPEALLHEVIKCSSKEGDIVGDFFCGSGTTLAVAEKLGRRWIGCDFGKVGIQISRSRLVQQDAKPFLIENIGNYQREMIYLAGGRIYEMQRIILKLYGATVHPNYKDLGTRQAEDGTVELVYVGYPDRPTTARKVMELARQAETLDGTGYKRLIILAWDYDYNFDSEWEARKKAAKRPLEVDVVRRMIPPDVYDYLKKAKDAEEVEKLADKIVFHEKPYLKLTRPKVSKARGGQCEITIGINKYVVFDLPVAEKQREGLREVIKDNFAVLIDYWAIDWDYDGATFRSEWQAIRGNGKRAKVVPTKTTHTLKAGKKYTIAVRVVDVFGNDAAATCEIKT